jgi:hypothetical protein
MPMKLIAQQAEILPNTNRLLAALPRADYQRMLPNLQRVRLNFGEILYSPGDKIQHIYFPDDAHVSLLTPVDHHAFEIGLVGYKGMVGIGVALGVKESAVLALVQGRGTAMRMTAARFRHEFKLSLSLQRGVHLYVHALLAQVARALKIGKLIDYSRGSIVITNSRGLEITACSCYAAIKRNKK